jgi:hypothetical protein
MKFSEAKCPKCGNMLQVPEDLEILTCMYCGKEISSKDMLPIADVTTAKDVSANEIPAKDENNSKIRDLESEILRLWETKDNSAKEKAKALLELDGYNYTANYILALDVLPGLMLEHLDIMSQFRMNKYENAMREYIEISRPSMNYLERACVSNNTDRANILKESAEYFVNEVKENMKNSTNPKSKISAIRIDDYKMVLLLFTIPMILELNLAISEEFTDDIIEAWKNEFPKGKFQKGTFAQINGGFKKKGFCYITTAVCESQNKADDCYELTMFRNFRDNYLSVQEDGQSLIQEYYKKAPAIVEHINGLENSEKIYKNIWTDYLQECLNSIEAGEYETCKVKYCDMVQDLEKKYS